MLFVDSHVHLTDYLGSEQPLLWAERADAWLFSCGVGKESSQRGVDLARELPRVKAFVGVHPSEAKKEPDLSWVPRLLQDATGVGEVGLDPKYSETAKGGKQREVFETLLGLAEAARKPVQVHSRGAEREALDVLSTFDLPSVLLHWFQEDGLLSEAAAKGYFVSFGPALLTSGRLKKMASAVDVSQALTESDGPVTFRSLGGFGGPVSVPSVVHELAAIWKLKFEEARDIVAANGRRFVSRG
jgi:TatD DNase family protein